MLALAVTIVVLGLTAGALVTEGVVLVRFWRSLTPEAFLAWYRRHAGLLFRFFGSLEIAAALAALATLGLGWRADGAVSPLLVLAAGLTVAVLLVFPLYFRRVNASFEAAGIAPERVGPELARWARWHWLRTTFALGAFLAVVAVGVGGCQGGR